MIFASSLIFFFLFFWCGLGAVCLSWGKAVPLEANRRGYLVVRPQSIPGHGLSARYPQQSPVTKANLPAQHPVLIYSDKASSTIKTHSHNQGFLPCVCKYGDQGERAKPRPPAPSYSPHGAASRSVSAPWLLLALFPWSPTGLNPSCFHPYSHPLIGTRCSPCGTRTSCVLGPLIRHLVVGFELQRPCRSHQRC